MGHLLSGIGQRLSAAAHLPGLHASGSATKREEAGGDEARSAKANASKLVPCPLLPELRKIPCAGQCSMSRAKRRKWRISADLIPRRSRPRPLRPAPMSAGGHWHGYCLSGIGQAAGGDEWTRVSVSAAASSSTTIRTSCFPPGCCCATCSPRSPTFQEPERGAGGDGAGAARRHPARRQFRPRRDQRRRGLPLARRDIEARPAGGGGDDHRPCRDRRRGRRDEARRHRFRLQALVERAAARHRPHRRRAAHLARRGGDRAQARSRRSPRRPPAARRRCSAARRRWRGSGR